MALTKLPIDLLSSRSHSDGLVHYDGAAFDVEPTSVAEFDTGVASMVFDQVAGSLLVRLNNGSILRANGFFTERTIVAGPAGPAGRDGLDGRDGRHGRDGERGARGPAGYVGEPIYVEGVELNPDPTGGGTTAAIAADFAEGISRTTGSAELDLPLSFTLTKPNAILVVSAHVTVSMTTVGDYCVVGALSIDGDTTLPNVGSTAAPLVGTGVSFCSMLSLSRTKTATTGVKNLKIAVKVVNLANSLYDMTGKTATLQLAAMSLSY